jgi:serine/threonine protein phosphatase PrpC
MPWKIVAASAQGTSHAESGQECQDAHAFEQRDAWFVGVVCDGAGSARWSALGAQHASGLVVRRVAAYLAEHPDVMQPTRARDDAEAATATASPAVAMDADTTSEADDVAQGVSATSEAKIEAPAIAALPALTEAEHALRQVVTAAIAEARNKVLALAPESGALLGDFNATLVGCAAWPDGGLFFHIGDGTAVALDSRSLDVLGMSPPENGEFAEQTFFYTADAWREHLRFTPVPARTDLVALMSDGTMTFAIASSRREVDRRFFAPVTKYLVRDDVSTEAGAAALHSTLSSPGACRVTHDDKTLLWAHLALARTGIEAPARVAEAG